MQAPFELTQGLENLENILKEFPENSAYWNEAQNRFQFVDRLLVECLGWEKPNIDVEYPDGDGGRSDYVLGKPAKAVLEAKRESIRFEVPPLSGSAIVRKIQPLLKTSKSFKDAVHQVIGYCALNGAQVAIVCNGPQLAIFQSITPGLSPLDGECYFFDGFNDYVKQFPLLWKLLSPEGVSENHAYRLLSLHRNPRVPVKASTAIPEPFKYRYRNHFQEDLRSLSSLLLEEIEDNPSLKSDFYKECYVPIEANNRHLLLSKKIIQSRYQRVTESAIQPGSLDEVIKADGQGDLSIDDPSVSNIGSRPIVVIGDIGVGKTSFFENLYHGLDTNEKSKTIFININLGTSANLSKDIKSFVLAEIPKVLFEKYGIDIYSQDFVNAIYHEELKKFDVSVKGQLKNVDSSLYLKERIGFLDERISNQDRHLQASLGHIAHGRSKQIILILDNADQRTFAVQQETFLISQELAATRNLLVFVALRPSTFYLSKMTGALSAYQNKVLTIAPPPADTVIQKRLIFAARVAEGKVAPASLKSIRFNLGSVVHLINATLRAVRSNEQIRQFLSNITGGNTRAVIELITGFFGSPNVDSHKIIDIEEKSHSYQVPLHEFTKHALLGEYAYFNSQSSLVACNIFDVSSADPREHFLASLIIAFLSSGSSAVDKDGFVRGALIIDEMLKKGFIEDQVRSSMRLLALKRLIETPHAHYREIQIDDIELPEQFHYRATSIGIYHIRYWTGSFSFLDAVATDTPIFDSPAREQITNLASSFDISDRFKKSLTFKRYLEIQWHNANFAVTYYDFISIMQSQTETFDIVKAVIDRDAQKRKRQ